MTLSFICLNLPVGHAQEGDAFPLAIMPFEDLTQDSRLAPLSRGLVEMLTSDLSLSRDLQVVERSQIQKLFAEIKLQQSDYFDQSKVVTLGKGIGATFVVLGSYQLAGEQLRIDCRVVDVESSKVLSSVAKTGPMTEVFKLTGQLSTATIAELGAALSPIAKRRVGQNGTSNVDSLLDWSKALEAEDDGQDNVARKALQRAIEADPNFRRAKTRLDALEKRIEALETAGGLILKPAKWQDHLHNARIWVSQNNLSLAEKSLRKTIELAPKRAELWTLLLDLPLTRRKAMELSGLSKRQQLVVSACLTEDWKTLATLDISQWSRQEQAWTHIMRLVTIERRETNWTVKVTELADAALLFLAKDTNEDLLKALLERPELFDDRVRNLRKAHHLEPEISVIYGKMQNGLYERDVARMTDWNASSRLNQYRGYRSGAWYRWFTVLIPTGATQLEIRISRDEKHPGWKQALLDPWVQFDFRPAWHPSYSFRGTEGGTYVKKSELDRDKVFGIWANPKKPLNTRVFSGGIGETISFPDDWRYCHDVQKLPVKRLCRMDIDVLKASLPIGIYLQEMSYVDSDGVPVVLKSGRWQVPDFQLIPLTVRHKVTLPDFGHPNASKTLSRADRFKRTNYVARITPETRKRYKKFGTFKPSDVFLMGVCGPAPTHIPYRRKKGASTPEVAQLYYDLDYALMDGKELGDPDYEGWAKYLDLLIKKGRKLSVGQPGRFKYKHPAPCGVIGLPKLTPGPHKILAASVSESGVTSFEPQAWTFDVPEPGNCARSQNCKVWGWCTAVDGLCQAASDADCKKGKACTASGLCTAKDGQCIATRDTDCKAAKTCTKRGRCTARDGQCITAGNKDCQLSSKCKDKGHCTEKDGKCVIGSRKDCEATPLCTEDGRCTADDGKCVIAIDKDCKASELCKDKGRCTAKSGKCIATRDEDCARSSECKEKGRCKVRSGRCKKR